MIVQLQSGKIAGNKDLLNELSLYLSEASERYKERGYCDTAKSVMEDSNAIYLALKESGYYK